MTGGSTERADVQTALAALERAERFVADVEKPEYVHAPAIATARADLAAALRAAEEERDRRERWWQSILRDVAYALRNQDDLTREDIAGAIDRALAEGVSPHYRAALAAASTEGAQS